MSKPLLGSVLLPSDGPARALRARSRAQAIGLSRLPHEWNGWRASVCARSSAASSCSISSRPLGGDQVKTYASGSSSSVSSPASSTESGTRIGSNRFRTFKMIQVTTNA